MKSFVVDREVGSISTLWVSNVGNEAVLVDGGFSKDPSNSMKTIVTIDVSREDVSKNNSVKVMWMVVN